MEFCFAAERTLGKLVKWLRVLGFDTLYEPEQTPLCFSELEPKRILLTRRTSCRDKTWDGHRFVVIRSDHYWDQLIEVIRATEITVASIRPFTRCIRCNTPLRSIKKMELQGKVPDYIWETHNTFKTCRRCRRIYWAGSHIERSAERIKGLFIDTDGKNDQKNGEI